MIKNGLVSVVMSVYNDSKYLSSAIESILNQTYNNLEFIIVNDGSTDKSFEVIHKYAKLDSRIVLVSRANKGFTVSLNDGVKISRGNFIARMDGDDISHIDRFEKQVEYMMENENTDILATYTKVIDEDNDIEYANKCEKNYNFDFDDNNVEQILLARCAIAHPTVMFKADVIKKLLYNESFFATEDYEMWLRALYNGYKIHKLKKKLFTVRRHNMSKSVTKDLLNNAALCEVITCKFEYIYNKYLINNRQIKCLIWGCGIGGVKVYEIIRKRNNINVIGYIDTYKKGEFNDLKIHNPNEIANLDYDYIFIATSLGEKDAFKKLKELNKKYIIDFCSLV